MASETEIANLGLTLLGETRLLASLEENTTAARAMRAVFALERDAELRRHVWNFARRRAALPALAEAPPFGFAYAYQLPPDWLRFVVQADAWPYSIEGGKVLTDEGSPLNITYVARVEETGLFDALFIDALAARLALRTCLTITGSMERQDRAVQAYREAMASARQVDAVENPPDDRPDDDWVIARELG